MNETDKYNHVIKIIGVQKRFANIKLDELNIDKSEIRDIVKKIENNRIFKKGKFKINFNYSFNGLTESGEFYINEVL
ncbi:MAG: hypothetical protein DRG78_06655 [Epsilonproteobacteria bacterium]|nr:MAG: hypothetical protein DRG78_06655 [Campylobacterota bacterium]